MGGCYLAWLGVQAWRHAGQMPMQADPSSADPARSGLTDALRGFRTGMAVNLSNPKGIAFFVGLYAVAVPPGTTLWTKATILAASFAIEVLWHGAVIALLSTGRARGVYARLGVAIERALGGLLALFGVRLVVEKA